MGGGAERIGPLAWWHLRVRLSGVEKGAGGLLHLGMVVVDPVGAGPTKAVRLLPALMAQKVVEVMAHRARHRVSGPVGRRVGLVGGKGLAQTLIERVGERVRGHGWAAAGAGRRAVGQTVYAWEER